MDLNDAKKYCLSVCNCMGTSCMDCDIHKSELYNNSANCMTIVRMAIMEVLNNA